MEKRIKWIALTLDSVVIALMISIDFSGSLFTEK